MKVIRGWSSNPQQPLAMPFPQRNGFFIEWRGGNFVYPYGPGNWFDEPYFTRAIRYVLQGGRWRSPGYRATQTT